MRTPHLSSSTPQRREAARTLVRGSTVLVTAASLVGTAGVAWAIAPQASAAPVAPTTVTKTTTKTVHHAPASLAPRTKTAHAASVRKPVVHSVPSKPKPKPVTTSGGS